MDIQSYKISTTKDKLTSRSGLAALAELIRKLGLDTHFERLMPEPGSNRGLRPGAYLTTFMLMMHEGSRHLSGVAQLREERPLLELLGIRRLPGDDALGRTLHALQLADRRLLAVALHHRKRAALDIDATAALREVFGGVRMQEGAGLHADRRPYRRDRHGGGGGVSGRLGLAERAQLRVRPPVRARPAQGRQGASRPHRRGRLPGEDHQPLHEPGNRLRDPRQARRERGRADRGAGRVAAAALHRARRDGEPGAADGALPALDERHARSVRGGRAAEAKVRPAGARARLPAGRRHPVAGRLHLPGAGDQLLPAERLAGGPLMQPQGRRLRKPHPRASQRLRRGASPVQRLRCQCAAFHAVHA